MCTFFSKLALTAIHYGEKPTSVRQLSAFSGTFRWYGTVFYPGTVRYGTVLTYSHSLALTNAKRRFYAIKEKTIRKKTKVKKQQHKNIHKENAITMVIYFICRLVCQYGRCETTLVRINMHDNHTNRSLSVAICKQTVASAKSFVFYLKMWWYLYAHAAYHLNRWFPQGNRIKM